MTRFFARAILASGLGLCAACGGADPAARVEREMLHIRQLSVPPGAVERGHGPVRREAHGLILTWEVETAMPWAEYVEWLQGRLPDGFELRGADGSSARFVRQLPADIQSLEARQVSSTVRLLLDSRAF